MVYISHFRNIVRLPFPVFRFEFTSNYNVGKVDLKRKKSNRVGNFDNICKQCKLEDLSFILRHSSPHNPVMFNFQSIPKEGSKAKPEEYSKTKQGP